MEKRILGQDLEVSAVGFGCMGMTHTFGAAADKREMTRILQGAVEEGYTYFDTAEVYVSDDGLNEHNEDLVGNALHPYRNHVKIATKFGVAFGASGFIYDTRAEKIRSSLETSLKRLKTDYIDLYYLHRYNPEDSIEEIAGTMSELIKEGNITHWGISTVGEDVIRKAHAVCPVTAVQNQFSMLHRNMEAPLPLYEELGIGLVTHCPLAKGFLTAAYGKGTVFPEGDWRGRMQLFTEKGLDKNQVVLEYLHKMAQIKDATPAQISLAYLLGKSQKVVPIPGTRNYERMVENAGAANIHFSIKEIAEIDELLDAADLVEM
ncbi:MAG: aldo/keto reductase [Aminipila sp.]